VRRLFWLGAGIAIGALVVRQVAKAAHAYTPAGLMASARNSAAGLLTSVQDFIDDVREGMALKEAEIHEAFANGISLAEVERAVDELTHGTFDYTDPDDRTR
jgi:hypothetical protein